MGHGWHDVDTGACTDICFDEQLRIECNDLLTNLDVGLLPHTMSWNDAHNQDTHSAWRRIWNKYEEEFRQDGRAETVVFPLEVHRSDDWSDAGNRIHKHTCVFDSYCTICSNPGKVLHECVCYHIEGQGVHRNLDMRSAERGNDCKSKLLLCGDTEKFQNCSLISRDMSR